MIKPTIVAAFSFFIMVSGLSHSGEATIARADRKDALAVYARKDKILEEIREHVAVMIPKPNRFEIVLAHINVNPGSERRKADYSEFNFTVSYKTEPYDDMDAYETVRAVIESAMAILTREGFDPMKNRIAIRCRTSYAEQQNGKTVFYSFGKGHWSYEDYHDDPIQFKARWNQFTDGE